MVSTFKSRLKVTGAYKKTCTRGNSFGGAKLFAKSEAKRAYKKRTYD